MHRGKAIVLALVGALTMGWGCQAMADDNAVIKGKIVFKGDVAKYKRSTIKTNKDPQCKKSKKKIGTYAVIFNKKTDPITVRNVMVYVKDGLGDRTYKAPDEPVLLTQFGCEYKPHVFGIMAGQTLTVKNGDATNHNIHFQSKVNTQHNFTQPKKGMTKDLTLLKEDTFFVKCDVHPWMGCHIQVFDHPFFAVTGKDGTFELKGLPAGKYTIEAFHEKFGKMSMTVEVASGETKTADFTYAP